MLKNRISLFMSLPIASFERMGLQKSLDDIGRAGTAPASPVP